MTTNNYALSSRSLAHLSGCKPDLVLVVNRALEIVRVDFSVVDGVRTVAEQEQNIKNGVSWTMDSRHLPGKDGLSFAADIYPYYNGSTDHSVWLYGKIAKAMFKAAIELNVDIEWGGFWKTPDMPHWQLSKQNYPK